MRVRRVVAVAAVFLTACASAHTAGPSNGSSSRKDRNIISADEIANTHERNAYEIIQALRPSMLVNRGPTSLSDPSQGIVVFLDDQRFGDLGSLKQIAYGEVEEIRFLSPAEAQARWGTGYPSGVILVVSKR